MSQNHDMVSKPSTLEQRVRARFTETPADQRNSVFYNKQELTLLHEFIDSLPEGITFRNFTELFKFLAAYYSENTATELNASAELNALRIDYENVLEENQKLKQLADNQAIEIEKFVDKCEELKNAIEKRETQAIVLEPGQIVVDTNETKIAQLQRAADIRAFLGFSFNPDELIFEIIDEHNRIYNHVH